MKNKTKTRQEKTKDVSAPSVPNVYERQRNGKRVQRRRISKMR